MTTPNDAAVDVVALIVRDCCESERADPDNDDTICIRVSHLEEIVDRHLDAIRDLVEALQGVIAVADRETDEFIRARAALRRFATGGES